MNTSDTLANLIVLSGTLRVAAMITTALAIHDLVRNGLHVRKVRWSARVVLMGVILVIGLSAAASLFRLAGESWAPAMREITHSAVSLAMIAVGCMVMKAKNVVGDLYSCETGRLHAFTKSGPGRNPYVNGNQSL